MKLRVILSLLTVIPLSFAACAHTEQEKEKKHYESRVDDRIDDMEHNIKRLQARYDQQVEGPAKAEVGAKIDALKREKDAARDTLKELEKRSTTTWIDKKAEVDRALARMDAAYDAALRTVAH